MDEQPDLKVVQTAEEEPVAEEQPQGEKPAVPPDVFGILVTSNGNKVSVTVQRTPLLLAREMLRIAQQTIEQVIAQINAPQAPTPAQPSK